MPSFRDSDTDRPPTRRKKRRFPTGLVVVLALLLVGIPALGGAGYYAYRSFRNRPPAISGKVRLLGEWTFFENDYLVNMNYTDGQLLITAAKNGEVRTERLSWTVVSDRGDSLTLRLVSTRPEEKPVVWLIEFLSDSQVRWTSKTSSKCAPRIYTRKGPAPSAPKATLPGLAGRLVGKWETHMSDGSVSGRVVYEYGSDGSAGMTIYRADGANRSAVRDAGR